MNNSFMFGVMIAYFLAAFANMAGLILGYSTIRGIFFALVDLTFGITAGLRAMDSFIEKHWGSAALFSFLSFAGLWCFWNNDDIKRWRRKLADRMAGVVREVNGRLKVVQPAGSSS